MSIKKSHEDADSIHLTPDVLLTSFSQGSANDQEPLRHLQKSLPKKKRLR